MGAYERNPFSEAESLYVVDSNLPASGYAAVPITGFSSGRGRDIQGSCVGSFVGFEAPVAVGHTATSATGGRQLCYLPQQLQFAHWGEKASQGETRCSHCIDVWIGSLLRCVGKCLLVFAVR